MRQHILDKLNRPEVKDRLCNEVSDWYEWYTLDAGGPGNSNTERFFPEGRVYWEQREVRERTLSVLRSILEEVPQPVPLTAEELRIAMISHLTVGPAPEDGNLERADAAFMAAYARTRDSPKEAGSGKVGAREAADARTTAFNAAFPTFRGRFDAAYPRFLAAVEALAPAAQFEDLPRRRIVRIDRQTLNNEAGIGSGIGDGYGPPDWERSVPKSTFFSWSEWARSPPLEGEVPRSDPVVVYPSASGFSVSIKVVEHSARITDLIATFEADGWSRRAFGASVQEAVRFLKSALRTLEYSGHFRRGEEAVGQNGFADLGWQLERFWLAPGKKDSFEKRIRNALRFLLLADETEHATVRLALCFTALEALLVPIKDSAVTETLALNAATLLQQDPKCRLTHVKEIKRLYNVRSLLVHGEDANENEAASFFVRLLAAGVLRAVVQWTGITARINEDAPVPRDFFDELRAAQVGGGTLDWRPPEWLAHCLPGPLSSP